MLNGRTISGSFINVFLLEKSRIINPSKGERNYHVFYHLLTGASQEMTERLHLKPAKSFSYLSLSNCYTVNTVDDLELYKGIDMAFKVKIIKFHNLKLIIFFFFYYL